MPNKNAPFDYLFKGVDEKFKFDLIVYDTFEIIDQNLTLYFADILNGLSIVNESKYPGNSDNKKIINLLKHGSDDSKEIFLFKYGFYEDGISKLNDYVISEKTEIIFNDKIKDLNENLKKKCDFFIYKD